MRKILVVNPFGIGDVLFSMPLVQAIRNVYADAEIGFLANERTYEVARMSLSVNKVFMFNRDDFRRMGEHHPVLFLKKLNHFTSSIGRMKYDTLIDLSLGRQYSLFAFMMGIRRRIGFDYKGRGIFLNKKIRLEGYEGMAVAKKQLELLKFFEIFNPPDRDTFTWNYKIPDEFEKRAASLLQELAIGPGEAFLAVAPGGGRSWGANAIYKQWDAERFAEVAKRIQTERNMKIVFMGDASEIELLKKASKLTGPNSVIMASEELPVAASVLKKSQALLCNDGGLMHLANMTGVKTVAVFGPVDERVYGPYRRNVASRVVTEPVNCRPCYSRFHFPPCGNDRQCLTKVEPDRVFEALKKVL